MDIHTIRMELRTKSIYDLPLRVTYYARVSSESDEQLNSLGNQVSYYEDLIRRNLPWTFVPGYIDEGLSGISTKKRENFNRMIEDARSQAITIASEQEIVRISQQQADTILADARELERQTRAGAEDYADEVFGHIEQSLDTLLNNTRRCRDRLNAAR